MIVGIGKEAAHLNVKMVGSPSIKVDSKCQLAQLYPCMICTSQVLSFDFVVEIRYFKNSSDLSIAWESE